MQDYFNDHIRPANDALGEMLGELPKDLADRPYVAHERISRRIRKDLKAIQDSTNPSDKELDW